ncbi:8603_t:CDS:2 [Cetraspora pellucida]|uniref:8603_t:CDS:1 n=1 Tax=Cetraspora pellucida TaxID=1433469 RepID=A0ACA9JWH0_9GLOM|nr:8603_t:CDS:2 [Cetraspora pellucida]
MNPDKEVTKKLRPFYGHIDNVELYPGLMTEKTKPTMLGSGIALPFTISRCILSDAVNLVRNDRFYTDDFNPYNLTSWGWNEIQSDLTIASGSIMYKLILRHVPGLYKSNSVFALYPFTIPSRTLENLKNRGDNYWKSFDYDEPVISIRGPAKVPIDNYNDAMTVLNNNDLFHVTYTDDMKWITSEYGYFLGWNEKREHDQKREKLEKAVYTDDQQTFLNGIKEFFTKTTKHLVDTKQVTLGDGTYLLDVVRDVCNIAPVYFVSNYFGFPLKTEENQHKLFNEQELYLLLTILFTFLFANVDQTQSFKLKQSSQKISHVIYDVLAEVIKECRRDWYGVVMKSTHWKHWPLDISEDAKNMIKYLESNEDNESAVIWNILGTAIGAVTTIGKAASIILDFYLSPENVGYLAIMRMLAGKNDQKSENLLLGYILEALRLSPVVPGLFRIATNKTQIFEL